MIIMLYYKLISFPNKHPIKPRKYLNSKLECAIPFQLSKFPVAPPTKPRLSVCLHFTFNNHLLVYLSVCYRKTNGEGKGRRVEGGSVEPVVISISFGVSLVLNNAPTRAKQ